MTKKKKQMKKKRKKKEERFFDSPGSYADDEDDQMFEDFIKQQEEELDQREQVGREQGAYVLGEAALEKCDANQKLWTNILPEEKIQDGWG